MDNRNGNPNKLRELVHKVMAYSGMLDLCFTQAECGLMLLIGAEVKITTDQYNIMVQMFRDVVLQGKYYENAEDAIPVGLRKNKKMREFELLYNEIASLNEEAA